MGVIKNFSTVINIGALNCDTFTLFLKFNEDIYKNKEIIEYLKSYPFVDWIVTLSGDWDIFAEFISRLTKVTFLKLASDVIGSESDADSDSRSGSELQWKHTKYKYFLHSIKFKFVTNNILIPWKQFINLKLMKSTKT